MADLWTEATYDHGADQRLRTMAVAKQATESLWGFLAQAQDHVEYGDRVGLIQDRIEAVAASSGASVADLMGLFDQRFDLLVESKSNPFDNSDDADGSDDSDDGDQSEDSDDDSNGGDDKDDDSSDNDDNDGSDDDQDGDSDDNEDDDSDDDGGSDDSDNGQPPAFPPSKLSSRYALILNRIQAGENPLSWGGGHPFV